MSEPRPSEEQWELLKTTIELADVSNTLRVVAIACVDRYVLHALRARLSDYCKRIRRPFLEPAKGEDALDWLSGMRHAPSGEGDGEEAPVLFLPMLPAKETFVLHRLNENRDNLQKDLRGVLCLVGLYGFWRRMASEAPDLWSVRDRSFEFASLAEARDLLIAGLQARGDITDFGNASAGARKAREVGDVLVSYSRRDEEYVAELRDTLETSGLRCTMMADPDGLHSSDEASEAVERALHDDRYVVLAVSSDYLVSRWMDFLPELITADHAAARGKVIVLKVRECLVPEPLRSLGIIDWTTRESRPRNEARLRRALMKADEVPSPWSPVLRPPSPVPEPPEPPKQPRWRAVIRLVSIVGLIALALITVVTYIQRP